MDPPVNFLQLPDDVLLEIFHQMSLYDLVWHQPANMRLQARLTQARQYRTGLTVGIGFGQPQDIGRESKFWHEMQNKLNLFPDGWHEMLYGSFAGDYEQFHPNVCGTITNALPNVTRLNIMFNCRDFEDGELNIEGMLDLIHHYAPRLDTFRLWASGPRYVPVNGDRWHSVICDRLVEDLFKAVRRMTMLETFWLDITEKLAPELGDPVQDWRLLQPNVLIHELFHNAVVTFPRLREFRYATSTETNLDTIAHQLQPVQTLQRIHIAWGPQWYEDWAILQPDIALKFHEITVRMRRLGRIGRNGQHRWVWPNLEHFFGLFNSLTRVKVHLTQAELRFLPLFRALAQVPQLQELKVDLFHGPLFTEPEIHQILLDRPNPLDALQILVINAHYRAVNCADITVWPLFGDPPGDRPFERVVVPHLVCFKMLVESLDACRICPTDVACVKRGINHAWFEQHENTVFVQCIVQWHEGTNRRLVVGDQLGDDKFRDLLHPEILRY